MGLCGVAVSHSGGEGGDEIGLILLYKGPNIGR